MPQVEVGDRVVVRYYEAIAAEMAKPGQEASATATATRAPPGARPGGELAQEVTTTVEITDLDLATHTVSFTDPDGLAQTIRCRIQDAGLRRDAQSRRRGRGSLRGARDQRQPGQPVNGGRGPT